MLCFALLCFALRCALCDIVLEYILFYIVVKYSSLVILFAFFLCNFVSPVQFSLCLHFLFYHHFNFTFSLLSPSLRLFLSSFLSFSYPYLYPFLFFPLSLFLPSLSLFFYDCFSILYIIFFCRILHSQELALQDQRRQMIIIQQVRTKRDIFYYVVY